MLIKHLDSQQLQTLRGEFERIDTDNSGFLEYKELKHALGKYGGEMSTQEIDSMIHELDFSENHKINYTEFLAAQVELKKFLTNDRLHSIFSAFDVDGCGVITQKDLKEAFTKFGKDLKQAELDQIWEKHHKNGDKDHTGITFDEFKKMLLEDDKELTAVFGA